MQTDLNMDFAKRVVIDTDTQPWVNSPRVGVRRRTLERELAESGRATSIVRYAPGSSFPAHVHRGGEEFLVLDGVFSDHTGDFGPGFYVRNPVGSEHEPFSRGGATIFVKLWQMDPNDRDQVRVDTNRAGWQRGPADGLFVMPLHEWGAEQVALVKFAAGTRFERHVHHGGEEILVLDGVIEDEKGRYGAGTWLRNPPGSAHAPFTATGATLYVKTGHLPGPGFAAVDKGAAAAVTNTPVQNTHA